MDTDDLTIAQAATDIPIRNVWYMLLYSWDLAQWKGKFRAENEPAPSLLGLLARILAESTESLVQKQLRRSHEPHHEVIRGIRGRIDFATCLKKRTFEKGAASCHYSELSIDTLKNRIILATLHRLSKDNRIELPRKSSETDHLRQSLHLLIREMQGVTFAPVNLSDFSRLQLTRNDHDYFLPITICALIHRLEMPTEAHGDHALVELLRDEIRFNNLFERFVCNFYRYRLERTHKVHYQQQLSWPDELKSLFVPKMQTDITLVNQGTKSRIVIDTKYSKSTLISSHHGIEKIKSGDLYQLYAYLRTQEEQSSSHRDATGILLYPTTKHDIHEKMRVQGHLIRVETINLMKPWREIEGDLIELTAAD